MQQQRQGHEQTDAAGHRQRTAVLKKRSKKLLQIEASLVRPARRQTNKSFLVLFFKKELLSYAFG
jgi:hypothetical protein